jgi:hypothetical protein
VVAALARVDDHASSKLEVVGPAPTTTTTVVASSVLAGDPTTTTSPAATTTPPATATTSARPPTTTTARPGSTTNAPTSSTAAPATTTTVACVNSFDRACGPVVWNPAPGVNQPLTVSVSFTPQTPKMGDTVVFRAVVDDPDAPISDCVPGQQYGDGSGGSTCALAACPPQFGPWTPVARPGHRESTFEHVYTKAGTFVATFAFSSSTCGDAMPYSSYGTGQATVVVAS